MRLFCAAVMSFALVCGAVSPVHGSPPAAVSKSPEVRARETGQPVELPQEGTERTKVFTNPDGSRTLESRPNPVRVRRDSGWVPIDTGLRERADGAVEPAATTTGLVFSGGGDDRLVKLTKGDKSLALEWPARLPEPQLTADSATYPEVYPGVDLVVHAKTDGFTQVLVVKNREAARNSALRRIRLGARTTGVSLRKDATTGNPEAADATGAKVFTSATPMMWDSSGESSTRGPADQAKRVSMQTVVSENSVEVVPDENLLTSPETAFPVYIDPPLNAARDGGTELWKHAGGDNNWNNWFQGVARVGYETQTGVTVRPVWTFDISGLAGKQVLTAWFQATQVYAWNCNKSNLNLWRTGVAGTGTTWNNVNWAGWLDVTDVKGANCGSRHVGIDLRAEVAVSQAVEEGVNKVSLALRATNETTVDGWRKFDPNPALNITYNSRTPAPSSLSTSGAGCAKDGKPLYINDSDPEVSAVVSDPDGAENPTLNARFEAGDRRIQLWDQPNGSVARGRFGSGAFADGKTYSWRVFAADDWIDSPPSVDCVFTLDTSPPDKPPLVTSSDFPVGDSFHGFAGTSGSFTFSANGVTDVAGFRYGYENPPMNYVAAGALGGSAKASITAKHLGRNVVYVQSVDRAGNVHNSQPVSYGFQTDQQSLWTGRWPLDGDGTDTADVPHDLSPSASGVTWVSGRDGQAVQLNGTNGSLSTTQPVVRTDQSFSVAAWVKLDRKGEWFNAVSQDGSRNSGFLLHYSHWLDRWVFNLPGEQTGESFVASTAPVETGVWTRLIGVYDAAAKEAKLYVNGVFQGATPRRSVWPATGGLQVGRGKLDGSPSGYFPGAVDDVVVYDRVLVAEDISELSNRPAVMEAHWSFDESVPADVTPSTLKPGAAWVQGRTGAEHDALALDGVKGSASSARSVRTDQSFTAASWVNLRNKDGWWTAVSQDGATNGGFHLMYSKQLDRWIFNLPDESGGGETFVASSNAPTLNAWTYLVGVYDASAKQLRLYVDGVAQTPVAKQGHWNATGSLQIGRGKIGGADWGHFPGLVEGTHVYARALTAAEVTAARGGNPPAGAVWRLDPTGRAAGDATARKHTASLIGGASLDTGSLVLDGSTGYATTTSPVVRTDQSFSVVATVEPTGTGGYTPVISQIGDTTSGFVLEYAEATKTWTFVMTDADKTGAQQFSVQANMPAVPNEDVHLTAVYDAAAGELRLYVDGTPQGNPTKYTSFWHARGPVQIGQGKHGGAPLNPFPGVIGEARLYQGVLTPAEIRQLADS